MATPQGNTLVKELRTVDEDARVVGATQLVEPRATAPTVLPDAGASVFERLARDPNCDPDKLERLMAMHERMLATQAKAEYYADFAQMQAKLPTVAERGMTNNGRYATHEDIVEAVRPVLKEFGFILTFRTKFPDPSTVHVVGVLAHRSGHAEETDFISKADTSGNKNAIQALGSAQSYGQRYTARALLNIASRADDDDGRKAGGTEPKPSPDGFGEWWTDMKSAADNGTRAIETAWKASKPAFRNYVLAERGKDWNALKAKAATVAAS